jgi:hypothetical protein
MATPFVSGVVALLLAEKPSLTPAEVKERLARTVDPAPSLAGKTVWGGRLNAYNALVDHPGAPLPGPEPGPACNGGLDLTSAGRRASLLSLLLPLLLAVVSVRRSAR